MKIEENGSGMGGYFFGRENILRGKEIGFSLSCSIVWIDLRTRT
jgi:hypothetical protein